MQVIVMAQVRSAVHVVRRLVAQQHAIAELVDTPVIPVIVIMDQAVLVWGQIIIFIIICAKQILHQIVDHMVFHVQHPMSAIVLQLNVQQERAKPPHVREITMCMMEAAKRTAPRTAVLMVLHVQHQTYPTAQRLNVRREHAWRQVVIVILP